MKTSKGTQGLALLVSLASCAAPEVRQMNFREMERGFREQLNLGADPELFSPVGYIEARDKKLYFKGRVVTGDKKYLTVTNKDNPHGGILTFILDHDEDGVVDYVEVWGQDPEKGTRDRLFQVFNLPGDNSMIRSAKGGAVIVHDDGGIFRYQFVRDAFSATVLGEKL